MAGLPALAAIIAAVIAGVFARRAREAEAEAARLRSLEERIAAKKYETYQPMIELLRDVLDSEKMESVSESELVEKIADFAIWVSVYGSDEAVTTFQQFMQAAYHDPPPMMSLRLYAEFVLAARRDLGYDDTQITATEVLGIRITDLYDKEENIFAASAPIPKLADHLGWDIPWERGR